MRSRVFALIVLGMVVMLGNSYAASYMGLHMAGAIKGAEVTYKDADEITIKAGYGECNKSYWQITSALDVDIYSALPIGEDFVYIYIDDSESAYPTPTIIGDIVEPIWSDAKMGWYNGDDRCIGVVWSDDTGRVIKQFNNFDSSIYSYSSNMKLLFNLGNPTGAWITDNNSPQYIPVNARAVRVYVYNGGTGVLRAGVGAYEDRYSYSDGWTTGHSQINGFHDIKLKRGWSRKLVWFGDDDDGNYFYLAVCGYDIDR